ncbi:MAG: exosortase H [Bryobacteraceae bacterium]|nr:exosortase H [Bryobacteraceae bacterium]
MGRIRKPRSSPSLAGSTRSVRPERFLAIFALSVAVAFGLLLAPFIRPSVDLFSRALVQASGLLIGLAGGHVLIDGTILRASATGFAIQMKDGCNGVNVMILLWSAVLAFPASWIWKAKGLFVGTIAIQGLNFIRFVSLFYLGQYSMTLFEFAHAYLWESLIMLDALVVFWLWAAMVFRGAPVRDALH